MRVEKIANRQLLYIVFIMRTTVILSVLPVLTTGTARQDAWASGLFVFFGTALLVVLITSLGACFPRQTVIEYSRQLLGRAGGALVSLIILWSFLHMASLEMRIYAEVITGGFLTETPLAFVIGVIVFSAVAAAYAGIEVIGRLADLYFPLLMAMLAVTYFTLLFEFDFLNLQPVLSRGIGLVLEGAYNPVAYTSYLLVLGILVPSLNQPRKALPTALWAVAGASMALIISAFLTVAVLGPEVGFHSVFPMFKAIRAVKVTDFLERIEIFLVVSWGLSLFVALSTFIYCGGQGVARLFSLKDYRHILAPMGIIWVVLSLHNSLDMFEFRNLYLQHVFAPYGLFLILFPYVLLWGAYLFRKALGQNLQEGQEETGENN